MAGKSKSVMGAVQPEEIKTKFRSLTEQWINLKKYNNFGGLSSYGQFLGDTVYPKLPTDFLDNIK
jgi:hypothetical protein